MASKWKLGRKKSAHQNMHVLNPSLISLIVFFAISNVRGDDADPEELVPGLIGRYSVLGTAVERVDPDIQFVWRDEVPDGRLPHGPFTAEWRGQILVRSESKYTFVFYLEGSASITVDGREVLRGSGDEPAWRDGSPLVLEPGEHSLVVRYETPEPRGAIRLFWSSEAFPLEPVPANALFHEGERADLTRRERGEDLYQSLRCAACHRGEHEAPIPDVPPLDQVTIGLSMAELLSWLRDPGKDRPHARMPGFGFSEDEAESVAAYLRSRELPFKEVFPEVGERAASFRRGELLFRTIGCLACHTQGELGTVSPFGGGDLTNVGRRRSAAWLSVWLQAPEKLNRRHRMPRFDFGEEERRDLVVFLGGREPPLQSAQESAGRGDQPDGERIARGQKLVRAARCAACHQEEGDPPDLSAIPPLGRALGTGSRGCFEAPPDRSLSRPAYRLSEEDQLALRSVIGPEAQARSPEGARHAALRQMKWNNCRNCHERDGGSGLARVAGRVTTMDSELTGQSEALLPPDLTAVGDKLTDRFLATAVLGRQETRRLPWLRVRMPRFNAPAPGTVGIDRWLIDHDRIPERPAAAAPKIAPLTKELQSAGRLLAGTRGFSCVGCHKVGKFEPRNVAIATRGSDLYALDRRMRPEFFLRWVRSPLRVIPNMEMPSFDKPAADVLQGNHDLQLAALWSALNDPKGPPSLDTSLIEQVLFVDREGPARVVRDVFHIGDPTRLEAVPRSFVVGFGNRANLLFDLDRMALRGWWVGDLARQRSAGKSWSWEPGGAFIRLENPDTPDIELVADSDGGETVKARRLDPGRFGRLKDYSASGAGLSLRYELTFPVRPEAVTVSVEERIGPADPERPGDVSWVRETRVRNIPPGFRPVFRTEGTAKRSAPVSVADDRSAKWSARFTATLPAEPGPRPVVPSRPSQKLETLSVVPGYEGARLPLPWSIMPTALAWDHDGSLCFSTLKGEVIRARDTDGDGVEDALSIVDSGLAAPYGLIADGRDLIVAHKPELLRLRDIDGDSRTDLREVVADGWGYTDDYHDWTTGIVRDTRGNLYVGTGNDYAKPGRPREQGKWRGKVLKIDRAGTIEPLGHALRYPTGLAITPDDQVFVSDNQGVQNTFNEINHLVAGGRYGVPSLHEEPFEGTPLSPAIQVPHPWTRSINGIFFLPVERDAKSAEQGSSSAHTLHPFAGHGVGCEYDSRFLVRFTLQRVGETYQGAVYPFSRPPGKETAGQFLGTLCGGVAPNGDIYIGSFLDGGWLGGPNVGDLVRLRRNGPVPLGIREIRAFDGEFELTFTAPIDRLAAAKPENYDIVGYTRVWQGAYATPDSGLHRLPVKSVEIRDDLMSAILRTERQQAGHVYQIDCGRIGPDAKMPLWPAVGHYTMNRVPTRPDRAP